VTHDQAEAMVISDRIAVLHQGRVVQVGTAEELFTEPRTRFVAEFIGKTNLVDGVAISRDVIARGRVELRVASADLTPGASVAVSIRPHQIELATDRSELPAPGSDNLLRGRIHRVSYLGDTMDLQVNVEGSDLVLRVAAPASARPRPGQAATLAVAPAACIPLTEGGE
jgi:ABC-type Fe3+/spermidine/putrescine transport system ATPase subunit